MSDIVIIGGGHNGLVTAFYLAKAGFKPLVLERRPVIGGAAITDEIHPGFRCSTLAHATGPMRRDLVRDMQLERHGLQTVSSDPRVLALHPDGRSIALHQDTARSAEQIAKFSQKDATKYGEFQQSLSRIASVLAGISDVVPPSIDRPSATDMWALLQTGRRFRSLGKKDGFRLLRWGPMAVADLVSEWFETELLRAAIAARGIFGTFLGPWSAGSSAVLLLSAAADSHAAGSATFVRGGLGALTQALAAAAREAGAEIRTGAEVSSIEIQHGRASSVVLANGDEIKAKTIVSNADPRRTFLNLIDPVQLEPLFIEKARNYRAMGTAAKVNLALSRLPRFLATEPNGSSALVGRIHVGPEIDYLERAFDDAKYGEYSKAPYLDVTIPTLLDPSLAPTGAHVMSIYMQ